MVIKKKMGEVLIQIDMKLKDFCYKGCLDTIKIHLTVQNETVKSLRNRLNEACREVIDNFSVSYNKAEDLEQLFLLCFNDFYWRPFETILDSLIRKEQVLNEKVALDEEFFRGELENAKMRLLESVTALLRD